VSKLYEKLHKWAPDSHVSNFSNSMEIIFTLVEELFVSRYFYQKYFVFYFKKEQNHSTNKNYECANSGFRYTFYLHI